MELTSKILASVVLTQYQCVTDRGTNIRIAASITALCIALANNERDAL